MKIEKVKPLKIEYRKGFAYDVTLCRIHSTLPHYHTHDLELVYCLEGHVNIVSSEQVVHLEAEGFFSIDFSEFHYMYSDDNALVLLLHIDLQHVSASWEELQYAIFSCESFHCFPYQREAMNKIKDLMLALALSQYSGEQKSYLPQVDQIIELLQRYFDWYNYNNQDEYVNPALRSRFYRALEYCTTNLTSKITAFDLAERENINPNYYSQFFTNSVYFSFSNLVKYIRCYEAEHMLLQTDLPNYEIAYAVGFSDPKYFYAAFAQWWHRSPKEHRQMYQDHFARFKKQKNGSLTIKGSEAADLMQQHIAKWHLYKNLG